MIPIFLEQLKHPSVRHQKDSSLALYRIATIGIFFFISLFLIIEANHNIQEQNREVLFASGGWVNIFEALDGLPFPPPDKDIPKNLLTALHFLSLHGMPYIS